MSAFCGDVETGLLAAGCRRIGRLSSPYLFRGMDKNLILPARQTFKSVLNR